MSEETINNYANDVNNSEIFSFSILSEEVLGKEVNLTLEKLKMREIDRMNAFLNYLRVNMRSNYLISALNTNFIIGTLNNGGKYQIHARQISHGDTNALFNFTERGCGEENPHDKSLFFTTIDILDIMSHLLWASVKHPLVSIEDGFYSSGFYAACTPLEAILRSTLDCLYQMKCLQVLNKYFPKLSEVYLTTGCFSSFLLFCLFIFKSNINLNASVLLSKPLNLSVENLLLNLFIDQELPQMNYAKYFDKCSPSYCTYTTIDETNISYALTLSISLYGSLIIVLRFIASLLIHLYFKIHKMIKSRDIRQSNNGKRKTLFFN